MKLGAKQAVPFHFLPAYLSVSFLSQTDIAMCLLGTVLGLKNPFI